MNNNYNFFNIRSAAILTNSYVAGTILSIKNTSGYVSADPYQYNQLVIYLDFTIGSLTDAQIKVEYSHDDSTYYQETFSAISGGTSTETLGVHKLTATGKYTIAIPVSANNIKISAIGTGTVTSSSLKIDAVLARA